MADEEGAGAVFMGLLRLMVCDVESLCLVKEFESRKKILESITHTGYWRAMR